MPSFLQIYGNATCTFVFFYNFHKIEQLKIFLWKYLYKSLLFWYNNGCGKNHLTPASISKQPKKGVVFL